MADDGFTVRQDTAAPTIIVSSAEMHTRVADEGLAALLHTGVEIFIRGRKLVRVTKVKARSADTRLADGTVMKGQSILVPGIDAVSQTTLLRDLSHATRWVRITRRGETVFVAPPPNVAAQILCMVDE